ncbi:MAG: alkene reductase, partial [Leptospiraceae bacterium]|nr:alkene reductase [Leptospiraceae bacterium]
MKKLFEPYSLGSIELQNHMVMAPMTRNRSIDNIPGDIVAQYYGQRASVGLIITEGTSPSPNGLGYPRIPGIFSDAQVRGWKAVAQEVHSKGGHIFMQLMHTGRIGHPDNLPEGARVLAPSPIAAKGD